MDFTRTSTSLAGADGLRHALSQARASPPTATGIHKDHPVDIEQEAGPDSLVLLCATGLREGGEGFGRHKGP